MRKISTICAISNGYAFKSEKYTDDGARIIRITNVQKGHIVDNDAKFYPLEKVVNLDNYKIFENDILMSLTGNVGRVGLFPSELLPAYINQRVCRVKSNNENILNNKYLFYYFNSDFFENKAIQNSVGATQLNLSTRWLGNLEIPLPPLSQQKAIAAQLDKAQELVQYNEQLIEKYDELQQSLFLDMFGDPVINEKGWEKTTITNLATKSHHSIKRGPFGGALKKEVFVDDGYLVYEQYHALNNDFSMMRYFITDEKFKELKAFEVKPGDIIISCSGVYLGKLAIVPKNARKGIINQALLKITLDNEIMRNDFFVFHFSNSNFKNKYFKANRGAGIPNFPPMTEFRKFPFILPPISLQNDFAQKIESIELQKEQAKEALAKSKDIFQGLLQEHFF